MEQKAKEEIQNRLQKRERKEGSQEIGNKEDEKRDMIPTSIHHLHHVNWIVS
jgi:hypothetical protein